MGEIIKTTRTIKKSELRCISDGKIRNIAEIKNTSMSTDEMNKTVMGTTIVGLGLGVTLSLAMIMNVIAEGRSKVGSGARVARAESMREMAEVKSIGVGDMVGGTVIVSIIATTLGALVGGLYCGGYKLGDAILGNNDD